MEIFKNKDGGWTIAGLALNRGLDETVKSTWRWYEELRRAGKPQLDVYLDHLKTVARECDDAVQKIFPGQTLFYVKTVNDQISLLEKHLLGEKSAQQ